MSFFGIGFGELLILLIIAFVVVGPKDLPKVARGLAKAIRYARNLSGEIMRSIDLEEELEEIKEVKKTVEDAVNPENLLKPIQEELSEVSEAIRAGEKEFEEGFKIIKESVDT